MSRGFTLVELLVVVAIICLLLAIVTPSMNRALAMSDMLSCASNMRQVGIATMAYAANNGEHFPGPNWLRGSNQKGWLYERRQMARPEHLETGLLWPYMTKHGGYRCPADMVLNPEQLPHYPNNSRAITSYCMNGAVCGYGGRPYDDNVGHWDTYRSIDFRPTDIIMWEADETTEQRGWWHDGANYPWEGITRRHIDRGNTTCADGHAEWILRKDYWRMLHPDSDRTPNGPNRLWCTPGTRDGCTAWY